MKSCNRIWLGVTALAIALAGCQQTPLPAAQAPVAPADAAWVEAVYGRDPFLAVLAAPAGGVAAEMVMPPDPAAPSEIPPQKLTSAEGLAEVMVSTELFRISLVKMAHWPWGQAPNEEVA